jgi:hypothetical protein
MGTGVFVFSGMVVVALHLISDGFLKLTSCGIYQVGRFWPFCLSYLVWFLFLTGHERGYFWRRFYFFYLQVFTRQGHFSREVPVPYFLEVIGTRGYVLSLYTASGM